MPAHWHALFAMRMPWTLPKFMHAFMSYVAGKTNAAVTNAQTRWQDGYYETLVKTANQFHYINEYILANPMKKGFVSAAEDWDASSLKTPDAVAEPWPSRIVSARSRRNLRGRTPLPRYPPRALRY